MLLQQHLAFHYRSLDQAKPAVDTGQRHLGHKVERRRRRQRGVPDRTADDSAVELTSSSTDQQLLETILEDRRRPPQYYARGGAGVSQKDGSGRTPSSPAGSSDLPSTESILEKIDSYLNRVNTKRKSSSPSNRLVIITEPPRSSLHTVKPVPPPRRDTSPQKTRLKAGKRYLSASKNSESVALRATAAGKRGLIVGDVIERFPQDFTQKRPFKPQVLRTSISPRLRYMRVYRAPLHLPSRTRTKSRGRQSGRSLGSAGSSPSASTSGHASASGASELQEQSTANTEDPTDSGELAQSGDDSVDDEEDEEEEEEEEEEDGVESDNEEDREEEQGEEEDGDAYDEDDFEDDENDQLRASSGDSRVPPLAISPDSDQEAWLREQAAKARARQRVAAHVLKANHRAPSKDSAYNGGFSSSSRGPTPEQAAAAHRQTPAPPAQPSRTRRPTVAPPAPPAPSVGAVNGAADEQAYVQFLSDVTSDILARGVFTNRILKRVMAAHVERQRGRLDHARMLGELERLREQLGIPAQPERDDAEFGFGSVADDTSAHQLTAPDVTEGRSVPVAAPSPLPFSPQTTFVDSLLFPNDVNEREVRTGLWAVDAGGHGAGLTAASPMMTGSYTASTITAPPLDGVPRNVSSLLESLKLDDDVTKTILNCYQRTIGDRDDLPKRSDHPSSDVLPS